MLQSPGVRVGNENGAQAGIQRRVDVRTRRIADHPCLAGVEILLADEPSGNLDHANSERLHDNFFRLAREFETAVVVATHSRPLAGRADRILWLEDGRITAVESVDAIP